MAARRMEMYTSARRINIFTCCQHERWNCAHVLSNIDGNVHMLSGTRIEMYTCCQQQGKKCTHVIRNHDGNVHMLSGIMMEMYT